ncbi:MAG: hypothetical protein ACKVT2_17700 [Saprospiraceae bacterium]
MVGNILLVLIALFLGGLLNITSSPAPGGDKGVGYGFMIFLCGAGFLLFTGLLAWNLGSNNCFDWVSLPAARRNWLVVIGWLAFAFSVFGTALFRTEWHDGEFPQFLRWFSKAQASIWLPLLILVPAFILLNFEREAGYVPGFVKIPMLAGFGLSILIGLGLLFGWYRASSQQQRARIEYENNRNSEQHDKHLAYIAEQKLSDPIVNILSLTGRFHDSDVRDAAIAKVKSQPDWEAELIRLLSETEWDTQVYHFIDSNLVEHPDLFVEPLKRSIHRVAGEIKSSIRNSNNLQEWTFEHLGLERLFRAIDEQFLIPGADYRPAVQALRKALNTPKPEHFKHVKFTIIPLVEDWLKKHP